MFWRILQSELKDGVAVCHDKKWPSLFDLEKKGQRHGRIYAEVNWPALASLIHCSGGNRSGRSQGKDSWKRHCIRGSSLEIARMLTFPTSKKLKEPSVPEPRTQRSIRKIPGHKMQQDMIQREYIVIWNTWKGPSAMVHLNQQERISHDGRKGSNLPLCDT